MFFQAVRCSGAWARFLRAARQNDETDPSRSWARPLAAQDVGGPRHGLMWAGAR
jgi:hypothetical protein